MEDRSALFNQLKNFSQRKLKKVETKVVTASGEQLVEKRGAKGLQVLTGGPDNAKGEEAEPPRKLDLQVGLVLPGFLIGSQDVAHDKSSLESYGVTHILNLANSEVANKFEDDYNYKDINIHDRGDFDLDKVLEDCFDFIDDGRHYGNVLIHCAGSIGLSRSTAVCIAYLMNKEKQKLDEAFNNVKEARSFVKPNEGFMKQLKDYEVKLRGAQQIKESGIDDPFALRKKQEIEQEKAMVAGAASVKNRMKMFGATLDTDSAAAGARSKSVSPAPGATQPISKSMTPEPKRSWQQQTNNSDSTQKSSSPSDWRSSSSAGNRTSGPPPPPPPMPNKPLYSDDNKSTVKASGHPPPPPPPPPAAGELLRDGTGRSNQQQQAGKLPPVDQSDRKVFGRVPPPPMKIKGGLSIERQDSASDKTMGLSSSKPKTQSSLKLPLKKQFTTDSGSGDSEAQAENPRAPSPSAALRAAKQQVASANRTTTTTGDSTQGAREQSRPSVCGQLNRSSTKKLLNLIKTKTKSDLTLPDGDENDEIEALLGALEHESIDHIDWDELGLDEDEVKGILEQGDEDSSSSSESEEEEEEDEEVSEEEEIERSTQHYVIRGK